MRYYQEYVPPNQHRRRASHAFDIAKLNARLEQVKAMGLIKNLNIDTIYVTDKALAMGVAWEKWFVVYLKGQYKYILSSPQVWSKILTV